LTELRQQDSGKVFLREATGLVRGLSTLDVFSLNFLGYAPLFFFALAIAVLPVTYPGANLVVVLAVLLPMLVAYMINYGFLSSAMPRAGGDFIYGSRVVHPIWGLIPSLMLVTAQTIGIGGLPSLALGTFLAPALNVSFPNNPAVQSVASYISSSSGIIVVGTAMIALLYIIPMIGLKTWQWWLRIAQGISIGSMIIFIGSLIPYIGSDFVASFDKYASSSGTTYQGIIALAIKNGWGTPSFSWLAVVAGLAFTILFLSALPGYIGGEIKQGARSLPLGIVSSSLAFWILAFTAAVVFFAIVPYNFLSAIETLSFTSAYPLSQPPSLSLLIYIITQNPVLSFLAGFAIFVNVTTWILTANVVNSRAFLAWAFDRLIPAKFGSINSRTGTPVFSLTVMAIVGEIFLIITNYTSILGFWANISVMFVIAYIPAGFTAALLPFRRKEVYEKAPSFVRASIGRVPVITITGLIHGIGLSVILFSLLFVYSALAGPITYGSMGLIALVVVFSIVLYFVAKKYRMSKEGINIDQAFSEIPPE
jgi:amino acid transporter